MKILSINTLPLIAGGTVGTDIDNAISDVQKTLDNKIHDAGNAIHDARNNVADSIASDNHTYCTKTNLGYAAAGSVVLAGLAYLVTR